MHLRSNERFDWDWLGNRFDSLAVMASGRGPAISAPEEPVWRPLGQSARQTRENRRRSPETISAPAAFPNEGTLGPPWTGILPRQPFIGPSPGHFFARRFGERRRALPPKGMPDALGWLLPIWHAPVRRAPVRVRGTEPSPSSRGSQESNRDGGGQAEVFSVGSVNRPAGRRVHKKCDRRERHGKGYRVDTTRMKA